MPLPARNALATLVAATASGLVGALGLPGPAGAATLAPLATGTSVLEGTLHAAASASAERPGEDAGVDVALATATGLVLLPGSDPRLRAYRVGERVRLEHRATGTPSRLTAADLVRVTAAPGATRRRAAAAPLLGPHEVTVVLLEVAGERTDMTTQQVVDAVTGPLAAYVSGLSDGAVTLTVRRVVDWTAGSPVDASSGRCSSLFLRPLAQQIDPGYDDSGNRHVLFWMPPQDRCSFAGQAALGDGDGTVLMNGNLDTEVLRHEFLHNLGLGHANARDCSVAAGRAPFGGTATTPDATSCGYREYGDPYDVMGSGLGHVNAGFVHALGLAAPTGFPRVAASTRLRLTPLGSRAAGALRGAVLPVPGTTYYLEHRAPVGLDDPLTDRGGEPQPAGVLVHRVDDAWRGSFERSGDTELLDFTPGDQQSTDAPLVPGTSWRSPDGRLGLTVEAADASGATVVVDRVSDTVPPPVPTLQTVADAGQVFAAVSGRRDDDSGIAAIDVLRNGQPVARIDRVVPAADGTYRVTVALPPAAEGRHSLVARVTDAAGNAASSSAVSYVSDTARPVVAVTGVALQIGALRTSGRVTTAPASASWTVRDAGGICQQRVGRSPAPPGEPGLVGVPADLRKFWAPVQPGRGSVSVTATDCASNATTASRAYGVAIVDDASWTRSGPVSRAALAGAWGGAETRIRPGGRADAVCRGTSCGLVVTYAAGRGAARILVDGRQVASLAQGSSATRLRQQMWVGNWPTSAARRITVVPAYGTVGVDALVVVAP